MPTRSKFENADLLQKYAEGRLVNPSGVQTYSSPPAFVRMIVIEVVSDPNNDLVDDKKQTYWDTVLQVSNMKYASVLPRNTVIAKRVGQDTNPMFLFPFFPSHLSLPCKAGECVWVMFENPEATVSDIAYWFCKVTEPHTVDDVNHTHSPRLHETSMFPGSQDRFGTPAADGSDVWHELRNGPVRKIDDDRVTSLVGSYLPGDKEEIFESLISDTDASKLTQYEQVPRFRKRPGDVAFEGTNNTLIVLGTDRSGPIAKYDAVTDDDFRSSNPSSPTSDLTGSAGSIDVVVGRGQTDTTSGKEASTTSIVDAREKTKGSVLKKELDKTLGSMTSTEGDPDFRNDRSRILISQRTNVDSNFGLTDDPSPKRGQPSDSLDGDAAVVIKTDKIRLIARSDVEIVVMGFTESTVPGKKGLKDQVDDTSKWASIVIKADGNIVFRPGDSGYIKLGDDSADRALLCTDAPATKADGKVSAATPPLTNTMGGKFGGTQIPTQGTWAKKVLVTGAK